jgi:hypothetical protein
MCDTFQFTPAVNINDSQVITGGGASVEKIMKDNSNGNSNCLYTRFKNLIIPVGLPLQPRFSIDTDVLEEPDYERAAMISSKKFDDLLYTVGNDLGISSSRTSNNKTQKTTK